MEHPKKIVEDRPPPEILVVGHVTRDFIRGKERLGGAASFATQAAASLGIRVGLVTRAEPQSPLLEPLRAHPNILLRCIPADATTTFELYYSGSKRRVRLIQQAPAIEPEAIPQPWRQCGLAYIAPVCGECGRAVIDAIAGSQIVVGAQGWLRQPDPNGWIQPAMAPEILTPPEPITSIVFSELDHPEAEGIAGRLARTISNVALTRGARGATLFWGEARHEIPASPAVEVDPTGAGDVFGVLLGLGLHRGTSPVEAARVAADGAAMVVEGPGMGRLADLAVSPAWRRLSQTR